MSASVKNQPRVHGKIKKSKAWRLFHDWHHLKNSTTESHFCDNGYLESIEYFRQRYFIEQRRAERKGYEFCLIIIDLNWQQKNSPHQETTKLLQETEDAIYTVSRNVLRQTDVVVKYCPYKIAILLPDTDQHGSQTAVQRIMGLLEQTLSDMVKPINQMIKVHSFSYPLHENEINRLINEKIFDQENTTSELEKTVRHIKASYLQSHNGVHTHPFHYKLLLSNDTIVIANPFCLLNRVFFDMVGDWQRAIKRCLDICISLVALILFLPVILMVSILIKLTSSGPIFFKQERIGYMGRKFIIYKFRTMYDIKDEQIHKNFIQNFIHNSHNSNSCSNSEKPIYKLKHDPRVTSIGRFLRRTSIDEIVQLFNVIKGDMSIVGPRPPIPYEVEMYDLWHKRRYLTVKPGITGLWQIYGRSITTFNDMVRLDLAYIENWSLALDLKILFKTVGAVLSMKGAF